MSMTVQARPLPSIVTELPGPRARAHIEFDHAWTSPSLPRAYPIVPLRGEGCAVEDVDGNLFLDFAAGIAVNSTGHAHPRVSAAIAKQAAELIHFSASDFYLPIYAHAAERLARTAPMQGPVRVFIGNSGAEAVEAGIKLARYHTRRPNIVAFLGAFHGRTMGAVSLTASKAKYHAHFGPLLPGVYHVPFGSAGLDELEQRVFRRLMPAEEFAAIIVEPIQGEGGYVVPDAAFFPRLREICDRHGILLIADEVQSGAGRTGKMWAIEHFGVEPDILLTAKGIASGMPIGAMIAKAEVMAWGPGSHGSTYGGNPVALAALMETMALLEEGLIQNAAERGEQAMRGLRPLVEHYPDARPRRPGQGPHDRHPVRLRRHRRGRPDAGLRARAPGPRGRRRLRPHVAAARRDRRGDGDRDPDLRRGGRPRCRPSSGGRRARSRRPVARASFAISSARRSSAGPC